MNSPALPAAVRRKKLRRFKFFIKAGIDKRSKDTKSFGYWKN
jgi:hypothetical protein